MHRAASFVVPRVVGVEDPLSTELPQSKERGAVQHAC
jgi:hypothetical protein